MTLLKSILTAGALAFCVQMASASTIAPQTFTLTGATGAAASYGFSNTNSSGTLGLSVTAHQWDSFTGTDTATSTRTLSPVDTAHPDLVTQSANGLGEKRGTHIDPAGANAAGNSLAVNSGSYTTGQTVTTYREALLFSFSKQVRVLSVTFFVPATGALEAYLFDGTPATATMGSDLFTLATAAANSNRVKAFSTGFGTEFAFGPKAGASNRFYISSITVQVIPLPAGGILLASVLIVPFLRKKRRVA